MTGARARRYRPLRVPETGYRFGNGAVAIMADEHEIRLRINTLSQLFHSLDPSQRSLPPAGGGAGETGQGLTDGGGAARGFGP